jgi:EpsI family protein
MTMNTTRRKALIFAASMASMAVMAELVRPHRAPRSRNPVRLEDVFPARFGEWRIDETMQAFVRPADEQGRIYAVYDQVLERAYFDSAGERIMLSAAFGSEQSPALQVHRPEVCYAASGFRVTGQRSAQLLLAEHSLPVTRLQASMPGRSEAITYWTVLGNTIARNGMAFRWQQMASALRGEILDGMLVRISTIGRDPEAGYAAHARFARDLLHAIPAQHRERVFGRAEKTAV